MKPLYLIQSSRSARGLSNDMSHRLMPYILLEIWTFYVLLFGSSSPGIEPLTFLAIYLLLAQHSTSWPLGHMRIHVLELTYDLQAKGLRYSYSKRDVMGRDRTGDPRESLAKVERVTSGPPRQVTRITFLSFSDARITHSYLDKRSVRCWDRTRDLESRGPARSLGAVEAK